MQPLQNLGEYTDGHVAVICSGIAVERHASLFGHLKGLSTLLSAPLHAGLFYIALRGVLLSLRGPTFWLGALGALVYKSITSPRKAPSRKVVIPRVTVHRLFLICSVSPRRPSTSKGCARERK